MSDRHLDDDFDATVRRALGQVSTAVRPEADLADRLIANASAGRPRVVRLDSRRASRWMLPLLAAAAVVVLAVGGVTAANLLADSGNTANQPTPVPTQPTPVPSTQSTSAPTQPVVPPSTVVQHFSVAGVYFSDGDHGWAIGDAKCESGNGTDCPTLLGTGDGGKSWHVLNVPPGLVSSLDMTTGSCNTNGGIVGPCVNHVKFANTSDGYLWGLHEFYSTTDGGRSWTRETDPVSGEPGNLDLVVSDGWAIRQAPNQQCSAGCSGEIEAAPVGSTHWQVTTPAPGKIGYYSSRLSADGKDVYLFAGQVAEAHSTGVWHSTDGGRSWQQLAASPCGSPDAERSGILAGDGAVIVGCAADLRIAPPGSTDFSGQEQYPDASLGYLVAADSAQVMTASRVTAGAGVTDHLTFFHTADGGRTWQRSASRSFGQYSFVSALVGYAASSEVGSYDVTHDGGLTWSTQSFNG